MMIKFVASFNPNHQVIGLRGDMSGTIKLDVDASQLPEVAKLTLLKGQTFTVSIDTHMNTTEAR